MIFAHEDAALYICRYLHPDDIAALARTNSVIRAVIVPHMRYVVNTFHLEGGYFDQVIGREVYRPRFDRTDRLLEIISNNNYIYPNPLPCDYTGIIYTRIQHMPLEPYVHSFAWANAGIIRHEVYWRKSLSNIQVLATFPIDIVGYICNGIDETYFHLNEDKIADMICALREKIGVHFEYSEEFATIMREIDLM